MSIISSTHLAALSRPKTKKYSLEGTARFRCQPYRRPRRTRTHRRRWEVIALYRFAMLVRGRRPDRRFPGGTRSAASRRQLMRSTPALKPGTPLGIERVSRLHCVAAMRVLGRLTLARKVLLIQV